MRRALLALLLVSVATAGVIAERGSRGDSRYRVAAIFDTSNGMVAGQQVKVAGAVVGTVDAIDLAAGPKARVVMSVMKQFAPFRADASCSILPEGLISENYVQCDPGRAAAALPTLAGGVPTVPLQRTTVPFSLQDVLNILALPTDERLRTVITELGIGLAGRGQDLNALLRRANPALQQTQTLMEIISAQRSRLTHAVQQTSRVVAALAQDNRGVRAFVDNAAGLAQTTAQHRVALGSAVHRLPAMLAAVRPGLRSLDVAATNASPLLAELRRSAPGLREVTWTLPAFSRAGLPAVKALATAAAAGRPAIRDARPVVSRLRKLAGPLSTLGTNLNALLRSARDTGAIEGVLRLVYSLATTTSPQDATSHAFAALVDVAPACIAGQQAGIDVPGCNRRFSGKGKSLIPINQPACGPKDGAWGNERCQEPVPGGGALGGLLGGGVGSPTTARKTAELQRLINKAMSGQPTSPKQVEPLLDYLLK